MSERSPSLLCIFVDSTIWNSRLDFSDEFSFTHMLEFCKLAVGFAVELGGWTKSD